jgi:tetratricopeptide (TPR) repeat protein
MAKRTKRERLEEIREAEKREETGYSRFLCERFLKDFPSDPEVLARLANDLIELAQYEKAEDTIEVAERVAPQVWMHVFAARRGHLLEAKGMFEQAESMFLRARDLKKKKTDATYLIFAANAAFKRGDLDRAIALEREAILCPEGCIDEAYFNLGGLLLSLCRFDEAAECYREALRIDPLYEIARKRLEDVELILGYRD